MAVVGINMFFKTIVLRKTNDYISPFMKIWYWYDVCIVTCKQRTNGVENRKILPKVNKKTVQWQIGKKTHFKLLILIFCPIWPTLLSCSVFHTTSQAFFLKSYKAQLRQYISQHMTYLPAHWQDSRCCRCRLASRQLSPASRDDLFPFLLPRPALHPWTCEATPELGVVTPGWSGQGLTFTSKNGISWAKMSQISIILM